MKILGVLVKLILLIIFNQRCPQIFNQFTSDIIRMNVFVGLSLHVGGTTSLVIVAF